MIQLKLNLKKQALFLIMLGILLTPLFTLQEVVSLFTGGITSQVNVLTSVYIKGLKDVLMMLLLLTGFVNCLSFTVKIKQGIIIAFLILSLIVISSIIMSWNKSYIYTFSGIRWALPLFLPFFIYSLVDSKVIKYLAKYLLIVFAVHFLTQIIQLFYLAGWFGYNFLGLSSRNPGIFLIPSTGAFFTICVLYVNVFLTTMSNTSKTILLITSFLSIILTSSGTGFVVWMVLFMLIYLNRGLFSLTPLIVIFLIPVAFYLMQFFLTRDPYYISRSGGTRILIFLEEFSKAGFISSNFGYGTNTAFLLGKGRVVDSMFTSVVTNTGISGFAFSMFLLIMFGLKSLLKKSRCYLGFITILILFGSTVIITEAYPMNLIIPVIIAYNFNVPVSKHGSV